MEHKAIIPFDFKGNKITTITDEKGEFWFVAKEICDVLGIGNVSKALIEIDSVDKTDMVISPVDLTIGKVDNKIKDLRPKKMRIVNESGLYALLFKSRKPEAREFKRWVTHEVLPSIRKTGSYGIEGKSSRELGLMAAKGLLAAEREIRRLERKVEDDKPKVEAYDDLISLEGLVGLQEAGKALGVKPNKFIAALRRINMLYKTRPTAPNLPYQRFCDHRWFKVKPVVDSHGKARIRTFFTPLGLGKIRELIKKGLMEPKPPKAVDEGKF